MSAAAKPAIELPEVTISEARGVRYLHLGTPWIQGAMKIDDPLVLNLEYVQRMMAWLLFRPEASERVVDLSSLRSAQLGMGAGAITGREEEGPGRRSAHPHAALPGGRRV